MIFDKSKIRMLNVPYAVGVMLYQLQTQYTGFTKKGKGSITVKHKCVLSVASTNMLADNKRTKRRYC